MTDAARVVLVTTPDEASAVALVERLVADGVVACGSIVPSITSIYRWQGGVERSGESLVVFKTTAPGARELVRRVPDLHPYDVPEVLVLPVEAGSGPYLAWLAESVGVTSG